MWGCPLMSLFPEYRSLAPTAATKRKITKTILQMSLDHHIVTPLTSMVIENEAGDERMLADSPPQDHSCCSGQCFYLVEKYGRSAFLPCVRVLRPLLLSVPSLPLAPRSVSPVPWALPVLFPQFPLGTAYCCGLQTFLLTYLPKEFWKPVYPFTHFSN